MRGGCDGVPSKTFGTGASKRSVMAAEAAMTTVLPLPHNPAPRVSPALRMA